MFVDLDVEERCPSPQAALNLDSLEVLLSYSQTIYSLYLLISGVNCYLATQNSERKNNYAQV
jgi:hypothetical protein